MKWDTLLQALEFLDEPEDVITLQVPYASDVPDVVDFIQKQRQVLSMTDRCLHTAQGTIRIEITSTGLAGIGVTGPLFLIERDNGDDGLGRMDYGE